MPGLGSFRRGGRKVAPDTPVARSAERIQKAASRGEALTSQLLAFSRKQVTRPEVLDLNQAIRGAADLFERMIGEDIQIDWALAGSAGAIEFDPAQFDQVVINLVVNSRDAMRNGGTLAISTAEEEVEDDQARALDVPAGRYALLSFRDSGSGIPASVIPKIFDPFFTTKESGKGTGLGLSTVLGIVHQHDGTIRVETEEGHGTTFTILFPQAATEAAATLEPDAEQAGLAGAVAPKTVMVVEDDALLRELICEVLEDAGYSFLAAETPRTALEIAEQHPGAHDLVVTDVVMPEMSGFALANELAARHPGVSVRRPARFRTLRTRCRVPRSAGGPLLAHEASHDFDQCGFGFFR